MSEQNPGGLGGFVPGSRIASYLLEERIGHGGMAVVFRAYDQRLDRTVALKILAPDLAEDEVFRQRFIRESRAAAAVDDPHIIPVFEAGEANGALFIAMRFVRGGDVRSLLNRLGPVPPGRSAEIVSQVASALDAAHGRGLVHRDVKPANILLDATSGAGRPDHVYLSDFGLSKGALQASGLTSKGIFLGTLDYISPEQIEGKLVDGRADQYALACAAFEIMTGTPPFRRDEATAVMYAQLSEPPPLLSRYRAGLPLAVDGVFIKALAKAPADRFGNCRDFAEALRGALGLRPFDSGPGEMPTPPDQPAGETRRPGFFDAIFGPGGNAPQPGHVSQSGFATVGPVPQGQQSPPRDHPQPRGYSPIGEEPPTELPPPQWQPGVGRPGGPGGPSQFGGPGQFGGGQFGPVDAGRGNGSSRRKAALTVVVAVVVLIVGGAAALALTTSRHGHGGGGQLHQQVALKPPDCARTTARGPKLRAFPAIGVPARTGKPFGIAISSDGKAVFVVTDTAVKVYKVSGGTLTAVGRSYPVGTTARTATTATVTRDGRYLLVASDNGIKVLDAAAAEQGAPGATLGALEVPGQTKYGRAVGVAVTPDDKFAFASLQFRDEVGVFNLGKAIREHFKPDGGYFVGSLDVGAQPVGLALSHDGDILYATAFRGNSAVPGTLSVVDVVRATSAAELYKAVISQVTTGCFPARIAVSSDDKTVWVTARESNYLLAYSAAALLHDPAKALIAKVHVGTQPIGIAIVSGGKRIVVSDDDNNSNASAPAPGNLAVVDTAAALSRKPALTGYIPAGVTPHEMVVSPSGRFLYVTDYDGSQLQIIDLGKLR